VAAVAPAALCAVPSRDSCIPVIGQWRGSSSTLVLTNTAARPARVKLSWIIGSPRDYAPPRFELMLHGNETRVIDVGSELLRGREAAGAVRIESDVEIGAQAIVLAQPGGSPAEFSAIPFRDAIATGETATLAGVSGAGGFRLFAAEVKGHPIYFSATVIVGDDNRGEHRYYIEPRHQTTLVIDREFGLKPGEPFTIILRAVNGSGRLVAAGGQITAARDVLATEMLSPTRARHRMPWSEVITYSATALALIAAAFYSRKS